ncbi:EAL domain-containing protein [Marinobacter sp. CHS3-4]|uniref:bifunctional diguanylate cyclase/phosphodiesterase n=1 Tax=Marinobacter sp. CHS3-4 TaxID=3045174 RepID=UPI0024B49CD3|nr:EAL domain-containing protein [Marinobacter sp. CHS3-4]MDI9243793.1 EAL domain-containing protein [Marinobacter sp. CHS3-4]
MPRILSRRWANLKNPSSRQSIMWMLGLLLLVFIFGLFLLSSLNLRYSQEAMSELRRQQIQEVVAAGLSRINARQSSLAGYTTTLANVGESFNDLMSGDRSDAEQARLKSRLEEAIREQFEDFDGAAGAGLWFKPGLLTGPGTSYMPYFVRNTESSPVTRLETEARFGRFSNAPWYSQILDNQNIEKAVGEGSVYWSPVYFDMNTERAVLTLASPMFDRQGNLLGFATTAWGANQIVDLVSRITVTDHSFAFLNDRNNRNLSSLSQGEDTRQEQALIDAILELELRNQIEPSQTSADASSDQTDTLATRRLTVNNDAYELYFAITHGGMVYGAGVPLQEINAVLRPMERTNQRILAGTVALVLLLSLFLLYRIIQLIRELQASYTDRLTGLPNRARLLRELQRRKGAALLIINLDRFSQINGLFGNECGDEVLLAIAERLVQFGKLQGLSAYQVYRLSGDEFAILTLVMPAEALQSLAEKVRHDITNERIDWQRQRLTVDVSIGLAQREHRPSREAADQLVSQAKIAVVQAREHGRHYLLYDSAIGIEENYENNLYWANHLKEAVEQDRLVPWFQPIHDNRRGDITKYECLVRMVEADGSVISAGRFVDIANKLRLNQYIAGLMIEKCFACFAERDEEFSINLSSGDLTEPETVRRILAALQSTGVGNRVIFEILESDGIANYEDIRVFIERVKPFGCRIAIDDFGTGYSNFAHLLSLNVDFIKIDGSLIQHLHEDQTAYLVTSAIVEFARSLNMQTVAEFVHNEQVQAKVLELGIDFSQGEYFSMARPSPDYTTASR